MFDYRQDVWPDELAIPIGHDEQTPLHLHAQGHLVYPAAGVLGLVTVGGSWIAPPNRIIWVPASFEHRHYSRGTTDMRIAFIAPDLAELLPDCPAVLGMTPLAREAVLKLTGGANPGLGDAARDRLRRVIIDEVTATPEQPLHLPDPSDPRLRAVARLVAQDLSQPRPLGELARGVGVSERTLSRLFRAETGMSFPQWRSQLRIHHALILLAQGSSVIDTATACGWATPGAFIAGFASLVGQTPGAYQRGLAS